jgi:G protein-coupled receptor GPR1
MFLIQSDMFKALWYLIYAIVSLLPGPIDDDGAFCQISGAFTALGVEASGLCIFLLSKPSGG